MVNTRDIITLASSRTKGVVQIRVTAHLLSSVRTDPPGALRGPLRGASSLLFIIHTPSAMTLRGPSGGHCVELHRSSSSSILLPR